MQQIVRKVKNIHPLFDDIERLYTYTSDTQNKKSLVPLMLDSSFEYLVDNFENYGNFKCDVSFIDKHYSKINIPAQNNNIILAFSGGKDSIAYALKLKEQGYAVHLYHVKGINAVYDEYKSVEKVAKQLDMPLYIDVIKLSGHHQWIEHPMKNMIIANGALQYGIRENITAQIAFGNYLDSTLDNDNFGYCGGDDIEMWESYEDIISTIIPDFMINLDLENLNETLEILSNREDLMESSLSCIGRAGLREYNRKRVENKYGVHLLKNRCGLCYKCAVEYIYRADHDLCEFNEPYYTNCINILLKNSCRETGAKLTIDEMWRYYFFYDISKSHLKNK